MTRNDIRSCPCPVSFGRRSSSQRGVSLIESLIATALLAFVAISIFPLLHQSVAANISGSDSNQATHHGISELERLLALPFDSPVLEMEEAKRLNGFTVEPDGDGDKMLMGSFFFDPIAKTDTPSSGDLSHRIASGAWIDNKNDARGIVLWRRSTVLRQYSYADIGEGVIDTGSSGEIVRAGHPNLFDAPLKQDALDSQINFVEEDVTIESQRPGSPTLRTRLARTY